VGFAGEGAGAWQHCDAALEQIKHFLSYLLRSIADDKSHAVKVAAFRSNLSGNTADIDNQ